MYNTSTGLPITDEPLFRRQLADTKQASQTVTEESAHTKQAMEVPAKQSAKDVSIAVDAANKATRERDDAVKSLDISRQSLQAAALREAALVRERDTVVNERDSAIKERDAVAKEAAQQLGAETMQERVAMKKELEDLRQQVTTLRGATGWAATLEVVKLSTVMSCRIRELGSGGFGSVSLIAKPAGPGSTCKELLAMKLIIDSGLGSIDQLRRSLSRELRSLVKLRHPNIVSIRAAVVDDNDPEQHAVGYLMDYIDGGTLQATMINRGGASVNELVVIAVASLTALSYLHAHGVYHRDVKPANIMVSSTGNVSLCDFGTATCGDFGPSTTTAQTVAPTTVPGTLNYLCPRGNREGPGDIYALALTLMEVAVGASLHVADAKDVLADQSLPPIISSILESMFKADPSRRPTAQEALAKFQLVQDDLMPYSFRGAAWAEALNWTPLGPRSLSASCPERFRTLLTARHAAIVPLQPGHLLLRNAALEAAFESRGASLQQRSVAHIVNGVGCSGWEADNKDDTTHAILPSSVIDHRRAVVDRFDRCLGAWPAANQSSAVKLLLVFHATTLGAAKRICECGFVSFATVDSGYFGKGLYFTPDLEYARDVYAGMYQAQWGEAKADPTVPDDEKESKTPVILAVFVRVRHVFPVTDMSYLGKPNRGGYDAHVAVVQRHRSSGDPMDYRPTDPQQWKDPARGPSFLELVLFESAQALPVCILRV